MENKQSTTPKSESHVHGGAPRQAFERLGIPPREVIDFSVNVSPLGPPRELYRNWSQLSGEIGHYPTINGDGIADYYSARFNLDREAILPGNGSTECIYLVPRALAFKKVGIITPSFHDYERSCRLVGSNIREIPLDDVNDFKALENDILVSELSQLDALLLGNPNNPTTTLFSRDNLLKLADAFPDKWILVDEAFVQFLDDAESMSLANPDHLRKNLLVFHSLTKLYDLPGIRMGAVISHPATIEQLKAYKEPWTVNGIAEKLACRLIHCEDYENRLKTLIGKERRRFLESLSEKRGIRLFPSCVNYMLARWEASNNLDDLLRNLLENGLHVRDCRNFRGLESNYFRFAILNAPQNEQLISCLEECLT